MGGVSGLQNLKARTDRNAVQKTLQVVEIQPVRALGREPDSQHGAYEAVLSVLGSLEESDVVNGHAVVLGIAQSGEVGADGLGAHGGGDEAGIQHAGGTRLHVNTELGGILRFRGRDAEVLEIELPEIGPGGAAHRRGRLHTGIEIRGSVESQAGREEARASVRRVGRRTDGQAT